jgi:hypothetical protein
MSRKRKPPPEPENPFVALHAARLVSTKGRLPKTDGLPALRSSKPSPASTPSAHRVDAMAARAAYRKHEAFNAKKEGQRRARKDANHE